MTPPPTDEKPVPGKGKAFFDRAEEVKETGNWDFAIEMYLEGIAREPANIEHGHQRLREVALTRKLNDGKPAGVMEKLKRSGGKDPVTALVNAEYLLAKEPGSLSLMAKVLAAAARAELGDLVHWICDIILDAQRQAPKKNRAVLLKITEAYDSIEEYGLASQALDMAMRLSPNDSALAAAMQELSAKYTLKRGQYGTEGDFTKGVKDMGKQHELAQQDAMVKDRGFLDEQIDKARTAYLESPDVPGKINGLVDALLKVEDEGYENEAIDVLAKAHKDTGAYQFKMRIGDIKIRQMNRHYHKLKAAGDAGAAQAALRDQLKFELAEYTDRAANYPTDLALKYELGRRQLLAGQYDEAIASFQQARRDPRRQPRALSYLGQAFAKKQWFQEAAENFEKALELEMPEDLGKEVRYNLGDTFDHMGQFDKAAEQFSDIVQMDYNYRDVRARLEIPGCGGCFPERAAHFKLAPSRENILILERLFYFPCLPADVCDLGEGHQVVALEAGNPDALEDGVDVVEAVAERGSGLAHDNVV